MPTINFLFVVVSLAVVPSLSMAESLLITSGTITASADTHASGGNPAQINVRGYIGGGTVEGEAFSLSLFSCCPPINYNVLPSAGFILAPGMPYNLSSRITGGGFSAAGLTLNGVRYDVFTGYTVGIAFDLVTPPGIAPPASFGDLAGPRVRVTIPMAAFGTVAVTEIATNTQLLAFSLVGAGSASGIGSATIPVPDTIGPFPAVARVTYDFAPIPEPATWMLVLSGLIGIGVARVQRK
jgi:hypothetical protein